MTRLDVTLILILVVVGTSICPVTSALVTVSRGEHAPREVDYQIRHRVQARRVRLKGLEDELGKVREKLVEQRLSGKAVPGDVERLRKAADAQEAAVIEATLALAEAESAAARVYGYDLKWHEWKTLGVTMSVAAAISVSWLTFFALFAIPVLGMARLTASWRRVLPLSLAAVLLTTGYQAGQVSGLIVLVLLLTMGGAVWLLVSSWLRPPSEVAQP